MNLLFISIFFISTIFVLADELSSCQCPPGYAPKKTTEGLVLCNGLRFRHTQKCNIRQAPTCTCTGDVTSIDIDNYGTWCALYESGEVIRRWACENREEWEEFYKQNPDYFPTGDL